MPGVRAAKRNLRVGLVELAPVVFAEEVPGRGWEDVNIHELMRWLQCWNGRCKCSGAPSCQRWQNLGVNLKIPKHH